MPISPRRAGASSPWRFSTAGRILIENASVRSLEQRTSRQTTRWFGPTQGGTLPREPPVAALHPWQTGVLDIADCDRAEFVIALQEGESAETRIETWPAVVRAFMDQHVNRWVENNKASRTVLAITLPRRTVRVFSAASSSFITPDWEVRPPFSLPPRTTTLLLGLGRVKTKSDLVVMPSGRQIFAFFCSPRDRRAQNSGCDYTPQSFYTARVIIGFSVNRCHYQKQCHQSALCPVPISAIVPSLGPVAPSDWQSPQPVEKAATLVDGYDRAKRDHRCPLRSPRT